MTFWSTLHIKPSMTNWTKSFIIYELLLAFLFVHVLNSPFCCDISFPYIMDFHINVSHQEIWTTGDNTSCCHHCNDSLLLCSHVSFHNVTRYTNSLLSYNIANLLDITCTLVTSCVVVGRIYDTFGEWENRCIVEVSHVLYYDKLDLLVIITRYLMKTHIIYIAIYTKYIILPNVFTIM